MRLWMSEINGYSEAKLKRITPKTTLIYKITGIYGKNHILLIQNSKKIHIIQNQRLSQLYRLT